MYILSNFVPQKYAFTVAQRLYKFQLARSTTQQLIPVAASRCSAAFSAVSAPAKVMYHRCLFYGNWESGKFLHTVDGRNPAPLGMYKNPVNNIPDDLKLWNWNHPSVAGASPKFAIVVHPSKWQQQSKDS